MPAEIYPCVVNVKKYDDSAAEKVPWESQVCSGIITEVRKERGCNYDILYFLKRGTRNHILLCN